MYKNNNNKLLKYNNKNSYYNFNNKSNNKLKFKTINFIDIMQLIDNNLNLNKDALNNLIDNKIKLNNAIKLNNKISINKHYLFKYFKSIILILNYKHLNKNIIWLSIKLRYTILFYYKYYCIAINNK